MDKIFIILSSLLFIGALSILLMLVASNLGERGKCKKACFPGEAKYRDDICYCNSRGWGRLLY